MHCNALHRIRLGIGTCIRGGRIGFSFNLFATHALLLALIRTAIGWSAAAAREMKWLHNHFVVQPADKETGVLTFTCRKHWETMLLKEVHETPTYSFVGAGARSHVLPNGSDAQAAADRADRLQTAAQTMRPNTRMPTRVTLAMRVTHRERVLRAHHLFGTLAVGITGKIPSNSLIEQRAYDVQSALEAEEAALQRAGHLSSMLQAGFREAQRRVTEAGQTLRSRPARLRKWKELFRERRPVTRKLRCPIDVEKLEAYVASNESLELLQPRKGTAAAQTGRAIMQQFLQCVNREPNDQSTGWMELSYRHSEAGAQLVAAGFVVDSREYANGPDPFKLRKKLMAACCYRVQVRARGHGMRSGMLFSHHTVRLCECVWNLR